MRKVMGWDIGGAHLKAVLLNEAGDIVQFQQIACPLWLGLDQLETAMHKILGHFNIASASILHAVTMTGELVDLFVNRHVGVLGISTFVDQLLGQQVRFYCVNDGGDKTNFMAIAEVATHTSQIASANWHASASLVAQKFSSALLVDIGSTTTDIIGIDDGKVMSDAMTDAERMQQDTLVYTGVVRTPVMAVAQKLSLSELETNVAAEYFASMADVYRLTRELPETVDMAETADGEAKTVFASARRLARMVGYDVESKPLESWQQLARAFRWKQCNQIQSAIMKQLKEGMTIVGAGAGEFLVASIAQKLQYPYMPIVHALEQQADLGICLPAYAVARLAYVRNVV